MKDAGTDFPPAAGGGQRQLNNNPGGNHAPESKAGCPTQHKAGGAPVYRAAGSARALSTGDCRRLHRTIELLEGEAETWRQGWAVWNGSGYVWSDRSPDCQIIHVRVVKLEQAMEFLRTLAGRQRPTAQEAEADVIFNAETQ